MSPAPKVVEPGGGELIEHVGWQAVIVLDGEATDGALAMIETRHDGAKATGASAHVHSHESETFIVLEGTHTFRVGDERIEAGPGTVLHGPVGVAHGFTIGPGGGRILHLFAPAGMEGFFRAPRHRGMTREEFSELRRRYGIDTLEEG